MEDISNNALSEHTQYSEYQYMNIKEWLKRNDLSKLIVPFESKTVSIQSLLDMSPDHLNKYLSKFEIDDDDKLELATKLWDCSRRQRASTQRSKKKRKRKRKKKKKKRKVTNIYVSNYNSHHINAVPPPPPPLPPDIAIKKQKHAYHHRRVKSHSPRYNINPIPQTAPKLYSRKTADDKYILHHEDEQLLNKLIAHQNHIQSLINHSLHCVNELHKEMESSLILVESEFNKIVKIVNEKKSEMIAKMEQIVSTKFNRINEVILWLKDHRHICSFTLNDCMQFINKPNSSYNIKTMVDNLINNQDIPQTVDKLKLDSNINLRFTSNHTAHIAAFLSSFASFASINKESRNIVKRKHEKLKLPQAPIMRANKLKKVNNEMDDLQSDEGVISSIGDNDLSPMITDLRVVDITGSSAMVTWHGATSQNSKGYFVDLNISDINYEMKENENSEKRYVVRKRIRLERDAAIYSVNLSGLRSDNSYKIEFNVKNNKDEHAANENNVLIFQIFQQFHTIKKKKKVKKMKKEFIFRIPRNELTSKNAHRFCVDRNGKSVTLKQYDSGTILYGEYLKCCDDESRSRKWNINTVSMKLSNISPSGFGVGFAQNTFNEYDGWNTGQNDSVIIYGNGEFYTSEIFTHSNPKYHNKNGTKLFPLDFMTRNDIITVIANHKLKKLQILNVTRNKKIELNLNTKYVKSIGIILWFGWTNGQSVTITNQQFI